MSKFVFYLKFYSVFVDNLLQLVPFPKQQQQPPHFIFSFSSLSSVPSLYVSLSLLLSLSLLYSCYILSLLCLSFPPSTSLFFSFSLFFQRSTTAYPHAPSLSFSPYSSDSIAVCFSFFISAPSILQQPIPTPYFFPLLILSQHFLTVQRPINLLTPFM